MKKRISLEPEAIAVCNANAIPPLIFQLPPCQGREKLEAAQSTPISMYPANIQRIVVDNCNDLAGKREKRTIYTEADVLRDEGEAFARKLRDAGVAVTAMRFQGMIHDFVMLNALDQTKACRAAMDVSISWINKRNRVNKYLEECR